MLVTIFLILPFNGAINGVIAKEDDSFIRKGYRISFDVPKMVLDCGSFFYLNLSIKKIVPFSRPISIYVFFRTRDDYNRMRTQLIGCLPYVRVPMGEEINVSIPCFTSLNLAHKMEYLKEGKKEKMRWKDGYIGVKIEYATLTIPKIIEWIFLKSVRKSFMNEEFWKWMFAYSVFPKRVLREMAFLELWNNRIGCIKKLNPFIAWKKVKTSHPFVYSNAISFELASNKNEPIKTDERGNFTVTVKIRNGMENRIHAIVLADLTPVPFINSLFPTARETRYNVGYKELDIEPGKSVILPLKCSFPSGGWAKKDYLIRLECGPSIQIGNINQFGIYTYNIRWGMFIKPNYKVNDTVREGIKNLWYNLPIFCSGSKDLFPTQYVEVKYNGPTAQEEIEIMMEKFSHNITKASLIIFAGMISIAAMMGIILYIVIRRKYL